MKMLSSVEALLNLQNVCRLCGSRIELVSVFDQKLDFPQSLGNIIKRITTINVSADDVISQKICSKCVAVSVKMFQFCDQSLKHNQKLKEEYDELLKNNKEVREFMKTKSKQKDNNVTKIKPGDKIEIIECNDDIVVIESEVKSATPSSKDLKAANLPINKQCDTRKHENSSVRPYTIHSSVKLLFSTFPEIKLPSVTLPLNINPCVVMELDAVENYFKVRKLNMNKFVYLGLRKPKNVALKSTSKPQKIILRKPRKLMNNENIDLIKLAVGVHESFKDSRKRTTETEASSHDRKRKKSNSDTPTNPKKNMLMETSVTPSLSSSPAPSNFSDDLSEVCDVSTKTRELHVCNICNAVNYSLAGLKKHQVKHLKCPFCKNKFKTLAFKDRHVESHCKVQNAMKEMINLPDIHLKKVELDLEVRQKYYKTLAMFPPIPGLKNNEGEPHDLNCVKNEEEDTDIIEILSDDDSACNNPAVEKELKNVAVKPEIQIKYDNMNTILNKNSDLKDIKIIKSLLCALNKGNKTVNSIAQTLLATNNLVKINNIDLSTELKFLKQLLYFYIIPIDIKSGKAMVTSYKYDSGNMKTMTKKSWDNLVPIDIENSKNKERMRDEENMPVGFSDQIIPPAVNEEIIENAVAYKYPENVIIFETQKTTESVCIGRKQYSEKYTQHVDLTEPNSQLEKTPDNIVSSSEEVIVEDNLNKQLLLDLEEVVSSTSNNDFDAGRVINELIFVSEEKVDENAEHKSTNEKEENISETDKHVQNEKVIHLPKTIDEPILKKPDEIIDCNITDTVSNTADLFTIEIEESDICDDLILTQISQNNTNEKRQNSLENLASMETNENIDTNEKREDSNDKNSDETCSQNTDYKVSTIILNKDSNEEKQNQYQLFVQENDITADGEHETTADSLLLTEKDFVDSDKALLGLLPVTEKDLSAKNDEIVAITTAGDEMLDTIVIADYSVDKTSTFVPRNGDEQNQNIEKDVTKEKLNEPTSSVSLLDTKKHLVGNAKNISNISPDDNIEILETLASNTDVTASEIQNKDIEQKIGDHEITEIQNACKDKVSDSNVPILLFGTNKELSASQKEDVETQNDSIEVSDSDMPISLVSTNKELGESQQSKDIEKIEDCKIITEVQNIPREKDFDSNVSIKLFSTNKELVESQNDDIEGKIEDHKMNTETQNNPIERVSDCNLSMQLFSTNKGLSESQQNEDIERKIEEHKMNTETQNDPSEISSNSNVPIPLFSTNKERAESQQNNDIEGQIEDHKMNTEIQNDPIEKVTDSNVPIPLFSINKGPCEIQQSEDIERKIEDHKVITETQNDPIEKVSDSNLPIPMFRTNKELMAHNAEKEVEVENILSLNDENTKISDDSRPQSSSSTESESVFSLR